MYAKINNGVVEKYPYTIGDLRKDNSNTSFPKQIPTTVLNDFGVFEVKKIDPPKIDYTKTWKESSPVFENGEWKQSYTILDASQEEIASRTEQAAKAVRATRDAKLAETDWRVIKHLELNENIPGAWEVYRQALRDVPAQDGFPHNVTWPVKPE